MIKSVLSILTIVAVLIIYCNSCMLRNEPLPGYDLSYPDAVLALPDILNEISGLTIIDSITVACIQDENGVVIFYDILNNEVKRKLNFNIDGDYEDIVRVDKTLYVLRSDGVLFEISDFDSENFNLEFYETGIPAKDNEGLCYDGENNRLLIGCKVKTGKGYENRDKRSIYSFDLATKTLSAEPTFTFDVDAVLKFALRNNIKLKTRQTKKNPFPQPVLKFRTSAICIHPLTKKLFLISSEDHLLFIFNPDGTLENIEKLHHRLFIQPEGLTFIGNGDILISNEGKNKSPTILRFNFKN